MGEKPSRYQLIKYSILYILSESNEGETCEGLSTISGFREKDIIHVLSQLLSWTDIRKVQDNPATRYLITDKGTRKLTFFKKTKNYDEYWTPPWDE